PAVQFAAARDFPEMSDTPVWKDVSPRLGLTYDVFGNGRTAAKVSVSRYLVVETFSVAGANNPLNTYVNTATRTWSDLNGNLLPDCDFLNPDPNVECGRISNLNFGRQVVSTRYNPEYLQVSGNRTDDWETTIGVQQELFPRVALDVAYFHRSYGHFVA